MNKLRVIGLGGMVAAALLLGGCVVAPPGYPQQSYDAYGQPVYVQAAPVVVAPPAVSIGIGGFLRGGGGYRGGYGRGYYRGGGGYWR